MVNIAAVNIWGKMVGVAAWDNEHGYGAFEFSESFLDSGLDVAPLLMPLEKAKTGKRIFSFPELNPETFRGLPGMLADSLPDRFGNKLIDAWLAKQGRSAIGLNPVERLCYTGRRGMGALEYEPVINAFDTKSNPIEIKELVNLAKDILHEREDLKADLSHDAEQGLGEIIRVGTSAGGARAKAVIAYNETTGETRSGQIDHLDGFAYYLIKFDGVTEKDLNTPKGYGKIEYAYYLMAKDCGIHMMPSRLLKENRRAHFMTQRFDRIGNEKLHLQTLCALQHFDYNDPNAYSYEQAFQTMRQLRLPYIDAEQMYRRMVFNVIGRNQDDHTKNISFLMDKTGQWSLSPAYDVSYAYDPNNKWIKAHQMSVNGKRENITREDLLEVAKQMNIKKPKDVIEEVRHSIVRWGYFANEAGVDKEQVGLIGKLLLVRL